MAGKARLKEQQVSNIFGWISFSVMVFCSRFKQLLALTSIFIEVAPPDSQNIWKWESSAETPVRDFSQHELCAKDVVLTKLSGTQGLLEMPALVCVFTAMQKEDSIQPSWKMQLVENTALLHRSCAFLLNRAAAITSNALFANRSACKGKAQACDTFAHVAEGFPCKSSSWTYKALVQ